MKQNNQTSVVPQRARVQYNKENKTFLFFSETDYICSKSIIERIRAKLSLDKQRISPFQLICVDDTFSLTLKGLTARDEKRLLDLFAFEGLNPQIIERKSDKFFLFSWIKSFTKIKDISSEDDSLNSEETALLQRSQYKM